MEHADTDWVEVAVAPDQMVAEMWQEFLQDNHIPAMLEPGDVQSFLGVSSMPVRVLVAEAMLEQAKRLLDDFEAAEIDQAELAAQAEAAAPEPGEAEMIQAVEAELEPERDEPSE